VKRSAKSSSDILRSAEVINRNEQNAVQANTAADDVFKFNAQRNLQGVLGNMAQLQREAFIKNTWEPYMQNKEVSGSLIGAGIQNTFGALQGAAQNKMFAELYAGK
jgi:hypothetical protein